MGNTITVEKIKLSNKNKASLLRVPKDIDREKILDNLNLGKPRGVLILNGNTAPFGQEVKESLDRIFFGLAKFVVDQKVAVITGGTNAGIFSIFGEALEKQGKVTTPIIGICVAGRVNNEMLEPHHTHFVLVEGDDWGDETDVMYGLAATLGSNLPSMAIFAGGGEITIEEMLMNVSQRRTMVLLKGSTRSTDAVITAYIGESKNDGKLNQIAKDGKIVVFDINQPSADLVMVIQNQLFPE